MDSKHPNIIDLFCGCGGFSLGFERAGFNVLLGIDVWKDALATFAHNHKESKTLNADLSNLNPKEAESLLDGKEIDVIIGGPPCQGFSVAGKRIVDDIRNRLYKAFVAFVAHFQPAAFVLENVPNILSIGNGVVRESIVEDFTRLGYTVEYKVLTASDYGVPQNRRRAFFVGFKNGHHFSFPKPFNTPKVTAKEALSDLPEYGIEDGGSYPIEIQSEYQSLMRKDSSGVFNHQPTVHNLKTIDIISMVPDGGNYKDLPKECCKIQESDCDTYKEKLNNAIRLFPGNAALKQKTIDNWRTEISALCAFYLEDKISNITRTSKLAYFLNENQDLTQFFKFIMLSFQFPGGHIKNKDNIELINNNVRFKPAQFILKVLLEGNKILASQNSEKEMCISDEEATFCIFNDLRVTTGKRTPCEVATLILDNRKKKLKYFNKGDSRYYSSTGKQRSKGDVVRYAGDVLDYMEYASLLERRMDGYFILKPNELKSISEFVKDDSYFDEYEQFYGVPDLKPSVLAPIESDWFKYVDGLFQPNKFKTDVVALLSDSNVEVLVDHRISEIIANEDSTTKDIGNIGEAIIFSHEKMRLKLAGYADLLHRIAIVDSPSYHPGYDIDSLEGDGTRDHRYIEVKTTISKQKIKLFGFHMSSNEWDVANTTREHYCVYRLMLSTNDKTLYILRNPVSLYKNDLIDAMPRNGMEVSFDASKFNPEPVLVWQD